MGMMMIIMITILMIMMMMMRVVVLLVGLLKPVRCKCVRVGAAGLRVLGCALLGGDPPYMHLGYPVDARIGDDHDSHRDVEADK